MRTKFKETGFSMFRDRVVKMIGAVSLYRSDSGVFHLWDKGTRALVTQDEEEAYREFERRTA